MCQKGLFFCFVPHVYIASWSLLIFLTSLLLLIKNTYYKPHYYYLRKSIIKGVCTRRFINVYFLLLLCKIAAVSIYLSRPCTTFAIYWDFSKQYCWLICYKVNKNNFYILIESYHILFAFVLYCAYHCIHFIVALLLFLLFFVVFCCCDESLPSTTSVHYSARGE